MFETVARDWRRLKRAAPGRRFQDLYEARQERRKGPWARSLWLGAAVVLIVAGPAAGLVPGPGGIVVFLLGLALLARELRPAARALDACEPRLRAAGRAVLRAWKRSSTSVRIAACVLALALPGICAFLLFAR